MFMKKIMLNFRPFLIPIFAFCLLPFAFYSCKDEKPALTGSIQNAANLQVILEQAYFSNAVDARGKGEGDANGKFSIALPEPVAPGIYRVRIGAKKMNLLFDGTEKQVSISGDLNNLEKYDFEIKGSPTAAAFAATVKQMIAEKMPAEGVKAMLDKQQNPLAAAALSLSLLNEAPKYLPVLQAQNEALAKYLPGSRYATDYAAVLTQVQQNILKSQTPGGSAAAAGLTVGAAAPNITLPDPTGKMRSLSDLKGQVVLIDFWASWCGPCRQANPHVVEVYKKYKSKGFTVFSVSLDGVDERRAQGANPEQLAAAREDGRKKWVDAIKKDNLSWEGHVSDLGHWGSQAAQLYNVTSIPRTYLLDRAGNIVAVNPRNDLEEKVKKVL